MKGMVPGVKRIGAISLLFIIMVVSSCKTSHNVKRTRMEPIEAGELLNNIEQNSFNYSDLTIKRINCQFSDNGQKTNFKGNIKAKRDKGILISFSKINIPVGRVLLTPDSVKYVNYINKNYFVGDYSCLSDALNFNFTFEAIQAILSNNMFDYEDNFYKNKSYRKFNSVIEDGKYVLKTNEQIDFFNFSKLKNALIGKGNYQSREKRDVFQKIIFNPRNFLIEKFIVNDKKNSWKLEVDYGNYVKMGKKDYPAVLNMKVFSLTGTIELRVRLGGFSSGKIEKTELNIPKKYKQILVREKI